MSTEVYTNELHEALLYKDSTTFWKCWRSKFESPNVCKLVEGCVDVEVIVDKFLDHFVQSYTANNVNHAVHLKDKYLAMRENYCGFYPNVTTLSRGVQSMLKGYFTFDSYLSRVSMV